MKLYITITAALLLTGLSYGQGYFEIGTGRYETDFGTSGLSIHGTMSKSVNDWFSTEGSLVYNTKDQGFDNFQFNILGDLYLLGLHNNTFQTHAKFGIGVSREFRQDIQGNIALALEEVVIIDKTLAGVIGYNYSFTLLDYFTERWYIGVRRMF